MCSNVLRSAIKDVFCHHKRNAKKRGIEFHFTLEEWIKWWELHLGIRWMQKRGKEKDQYCMARFGDKGPYQAGNVKCITNEQNWAERQPPSGEKSHAAKLTKEQVDEIRASKLRYYLLAQKFEVHWQTIHDIKKRLTWKDS